MIFVAPDGERSMNTYLGISSELGPEDVSDAVAGQASLLFWKVIFTTSRKANWPLNARPNCASRLAARRGLLCQTLSVLTGTAMIFAAWSRIWIT